MVANGRAIGRRISNSLLVVSILSCLLVPWAFARAEASATPESSLPASSFWGYDCGKVVYYPCSSLNCTENTSGIIAVTICDIVDYDSDCKDGFNNQTCGVDETTGQDCGRYSGCPG